MKTQLKIVRTENQVILAFQEPVRMVSSTGVSIQVIKRGFTFPIEQWEHLIFTQAQQLGFNPSIPLPIET